MTLVLPDDVRTAIVDHARAGAPEEVVGILAGEHGGSGENAAEGTESRSRVECVFSAENASETPESRYEIAPAEELELLERVEEAGLDVVGFYHSHPRGPSGPSQTDVREAAWPGYSSVIVSLAGGDSEVRSWRWTGEAFVREEVVTIVI